MFSHLGPFRICTLILLTVALITACSSNQKDLESVKNNQIHELLIQELVKNTQVIPTLKYIPPIATVYNREAIIPPQCYTRTEGQFNPCYICHQDTIPKHENRMNDGELQADYSFSELGLLNHWQNLFTDKTSNIAQISDKDILQWVSEDNYSALPKRLQDAKFNGWIPDLDNLQLAAGAFNKDGFAKDGSHWVAFNYKPLPSTFWPTNGSTDDVMIRLSAQFRTKGNGEYSKDVYLANLAIVEAKIKNLPFISTNIINENEVQKDIDGDGRMGLVNKITVLDNYVGAAAGMLIDSFLYPEGTEFLHTVRYVATDTMGNITPSTRMKEVRYMKKWKAYSKPVYARQYQLEGYEKALGHLPSYQNLDHHGLDNGNGWSISGFIEGVDGKLRVNTYEENLFCMGCHNSIGSTIDKTFSFARKVNGKNGWGYINLKTMKDAPNLNETEGEYLTYLSRVGGGDEFRNNSEMLARWFNEDGSVKKEKVEGIDSIYDLISPSKQRALMLNKAYKVIVDRQNFIYGRDATVTAPINVYQKIDNDDSPTLPEDKLYKWDIRLDWNK